MMILFRPLLHGAPSSSWQQTVEVVLLMLAVFVIFAVALWERREARDVPAMDDDEASYLPAARSR